MGRNLKVNVLFDIVSNPRFLAGFGPGSDSDEGRDADTAATGKPSKDEGGNADITAKGKPFKGMVLKPQNKPVPIISSSSKDKPGKAAAGGKDPSFGGASAQDGPAAGLPTWKKSG